MYVHKLRDDGNWHSSQCTWLHWWHDDTVNVSLLALTLSVLLQAIQLPTTASVRPPGRTHRLWLQQVEHSGLSISVTQLSATDPQPTTLILTLDLLYLKSICFDRLSRTTTVPSFKSFRSEVNLIRGIVLTYTPTNPHTSWPSDCNYLCHHTVSLAQIILTNKQTNKNQTFITALSPGYPGWEGSRNVQFVFSSWQQHHCCCHSNFLQPFPSIHNNP